MSQSTEQKRYWFIVADESRASIYDAARRYGPLEQRCSLENATAREKMEQLISDRGGRSFDSHGKGRHTLRKEKEDAKRHASMAFAREIVQQLSAAKTRGACREFSLIAAPRFLGVLREALSITDIGKPYLAISKNVVGEPVAKIESLIERHRE